MPTLAIINTGCANLASVITAFTRLGVPPVVTDAPEVIATADAVVLPGVGHFGPAIRAVRERGLDQALLDRVRTDRPLLGICLGMQLLCDGSDESPGDVGLGVIPGRHTRFNGPARVPQMGWNTITPSAGCTLLRGTSVYFANSYRLAALPDGWSGALADHAGPFVAAVERGSFMACQFHPELSGRDGLALLQRWLAAARLAPEVAC